MALLYFLLVLSVLVLIHEAGHYLVARLFKVKAEEFGYGFPPRLIGFVKNRGTWRRVKRGDKGTYPGTIWSINWLPLGGFVRIKGEQPDGQNDADSFHMHPAWQRFFIIAAGVAMNWLLAVVLFFAVFTIGTKAIVQDVPAGAEIKNQQVRIMEVLVSSPADEAGIQPNDAVVAVAGIPATDEEHVRTEIGAQGLKTFTLTVNRDGKQLDLSLTPRMLPKIDHPAIGVALADVGDVSLPPLIAARASFVATINTTRSIVVAFWSLFRDLVTFKGVPQDVSGPVGIAVMTGSIAQQGIVPLIHFAALLSVNLAVLNFLPIPALDGGRALFIVIEKIRRRPMNRKIEAAVHNVAFLLLIGLILLVTVRDLSRYGGLIVGGLRGIVGM